MAATPRGFRYPLTTDPNNVPTDLHNLALDVDAMPGISALSTAARDTLSGTLIWEGKQIWNTTTHRAEVFDGSSWQSVTASSLVTTKGDVLVATAAGQIARLGAGADGSALITDSSQASGRRQGFPRAPAVRAYRTTNRTLGTANTGTISLNANTFDTDGFHSTSTNTTRLTIPAGLGGIYLVTGQITWDSSNAGIRELDIFRNGGASADGFVRQINSGGNRMTQTLTRIASLAAGDYLELAGYQDSGASLDILGGGAVGGVANSGVTLFGAVMIGQ